MSESLPIRKIIHVDMDAFYASVEQLDNPELRGKPIAVGGGGKRGVVSAASYEARKFGVRSAMSGVLARKRCPELIFVKPRFDRYKEISEKIRAIFHEYTDLVEDYSFTFQQCPLHAGRIVGLYTNNLNIRTQVFYIHGHARNQTSTSKRLLLLGTGARDMPRHSICGTVESMSL